MLSEVKNKLIPFIFLGILFIILPLINFTTTIDSETLPRSIAIALLILFYLVYYFIKFQVSNARIFCFIRNPIVSTFFVYALIASFSLIMTLNKGDGIFDVLRIYLLLTLLLIITQLLQDYEDAFTIIIKCINISVILFTFFGAIQFYDCFSQSVDFNIKLGIDYRIHSTLATKNIYSEVLFLSLPFSIYGFIILKSSWKYLCIINVLVILASLVLLMNLYVWLAIIVCTISSGFLILYRKENKHSLINKRKRIFYILVFATAVVLFGVLAFNKLSNLQQVKPKLKYILNYVKHPEQINEYDIGKNDNNIHERIVLFKNTTQMIKDNFFTGVGIGNWKIYAPTYGQISLTDSIRLDYPHNDFLSVFSEMGVIGFMFYVLFIIFSLKQAIRLFLRSEMQKDKWLGLLMFSGILGFIVISFFGFTKEKIFPMILIITMVAICLSKSKSGNKFTFIWIKKTLIVLLLFSSSFFIYAGTKRMNSETHLLKALKAKKFQLWSETIKEVDQAYSEFYPIDFSATPLDWYKGSAFYYLNNIDSASVYFQRAITFNPYHPYVLNDLATCYEKQNNHKQAIFYYEQAYKLNPKLVFKNLIAAYFNNGELEKAYNLSAFNKFGTSPYLSQILHAKALMVCKLQKNERLKIYLTSEMKQEDWLISVFKSANSLKISFEEELINYAENEVKH